MTSSRFSARKKKSAFALLLPVMLALTACSVFDPLYVFSPTPPLPTETIIPTATIDWFPATPTPSPQALSARAPTPEMKPGLGEVVLRDDFARAATWNVAVSDLGSAVIAGNKLNLAAQSEVLMTSLRRETTLGDFYVEISAAPNLCRGEDSYGLLIRANGSAYYRFALSCNGMAGAERVSGKSRFILQEPLPSGDAPLGAGTVRMGVWALGREMRLFLNDRYQFTVESPNYLTGGLGVFVNAANDSPVVVSFFDLVVRAIQ